VLIRDVFAAGVTFGAVSGNGSAGINIEGGNKIFGLPVNGNGFTQGLLRHLSSDCKEKC
jgi:hypothetical protein